MLSSQTIGVEFSSKIIKVGTGSRRKRIKLQLWDTAGSERFRSVSRSYYRGAAGAILVYDLSSYSSYDALPTFLNDARALASPNLTCLLAGNKSDLVSGPTPNGSAIPHQQGSSPEDTSSLPSPKANERASPGKRISSTMNDGLKSLQSITVAPDGREVTVEEASEWASKSSIPVSVEVSAYNGDGVEEVFNRLAAMILTKIELGEIDPDDPMSGIQYGDASSYDEAESVKSVGPADEDASSPGKRKRSLGMTGTKTWKQGLREWENVFKLDGRKRRKENGCC